MALRNVLDELSSYENESKNEDAIYDASANNDSTDNELFLNYMKVNSKNELLDIFTAFISNSPLSKQVKKSTIEIEKEAMPPTSPSVMNPYSSTTTPPPCKVAGTSVSELSNEENVTLKISADSIKISAAPLPPKPNNSSTVLKPDEIPNASPPPPQSFASLVLMNLSKTFNKLSRQEKRIVDLCSDIIECFLPILTTNYSK